MNGTHDSIILTARLFLSLLFLIFGWRKLRDYAGTVAQIVQFRVPMPVAAACVAIFMEIPVALAIALGAFTRVSALLLVLYTISTALVGHRYWSMVGAERIDTMDAFYKNVSIMGGFLLIYVTGPGRYSIDALIKFKT